LELAQTYHRALEESRQEGESQRSEVRGQGSEVSGQGSEVSGQGYALAERILDLYVL